MLHQVFVLLFAISYGSTVAQFTSCIQGQNCHLPDCFCPTFKHPDFPDVKDIPQMVYFGFDDALHVQVDQFYSQLFTESRKNPNGCPITMSLYVQDQWTSYALVNSYYKRGMEIGSHSVTHTDVNTEQKLIFEAGKQKDNLTNIGGVPRDQVLGWRSPNLKPAGDAQPEVLKRFGYTYDISLTYTRHNSNDDIPWPYTLDYGYPYSCSVPPCPGSHSSHPGFWEIPVHSLYNPQSGYPCAYVDSCRPTDEASAFEYLWSNFQKTYTSNRAPFGLNMHAAWFFTPSNLKATHTFIQRLLQLGDVYIVSAKQVLDWMRNPVKVSEVGKLPEWGCPGSNTPQLTPSTPGPLHTVRPTPRVVQHLTPSTARPTTTLSPPTVTRRPIAVSSQPQWGTLRPPVFTVRPPLSFIPQPGSSSGRRPSSPSQQVSQTNRGQTPSPSSGGSPAFPPPILITFDSHAISPTRNTGRGNSVPFSVFGPFFPNVRTNKTTTTSTASPPRTTTLRHSARSNPNGFIPNTSSVGRPSVTLNSDLGGSSVTQTCADGVSCVPPSCTCRSFLPPARISVRNTPQIVYLTFMGRVDGINYQRVLSLLSSSARRNPNKCPISATFFVPSTGNYIPYVQSLRSRGHEVSMYGSDPYVFSSGLPLEQQLSAELTSFQSLHSQAGLGPSAGGVNRGYRSPDGASLGESLLKALNASDVLYDSSLVTSRSVSLDDEIPWPYTLDYGWQECSKWASGCPTGRYPGLWEVPVVPLVDYKQQFVCSYADACHNRPISSQDTYNFFMKNLDHAMNTNRAPLGINLRKEWFSHPFYYSNLRGLELFLDAILKSRNDVYVTSIEKMLDWMKNPTGLDRIGSFEPWKC